MKYLFVAVSLLLFPAAVHAAYSDVSLQSGAVISVGGFNLSVSGSNSVVESLVVDTNSFRAVMPENATLSITSADRKDLTYSGTSNNYTTSSSCTSSESSLTVTSTGGVTVTITPTGTCTSASSSGSSGSGGGPLQSSGGGGGGGGGGGSSRSSSASAATSQTVAPVIYASGLTGSQVQSILSLLLSFGADQSIVDNVRVSLTGSVSVPAVSASFTVSLKPGMTHSQVKLLQVLLNKFPDTQLAETGSGSPGNETDYYGAITQRAVEKFQVKHGIVSSGSPSTTGYGSVGPKTRAKLNEVNGH